MLLTTSIRRIYDNPKGNSRDFRILVDRRWSRGLSKDEVKVDLWQKEMAPSNSLRKWNEFKRRYFKELDKKSDLVNIIVNKANERAITLLYGTKEERFNNAVALKEYLEEKVKK